MQPRVALGLLAVLSACGGSVSARQERPEAPASRVAASVPLRLERDGLRGPGGLVSAADCRKDRAALARALLGGSLPSSAASLSGLPEAFVATPLLIDAPADEDLTRALDFLGALASSGPPHYVNLALRTSTGEIGVPVLLPLKEKPLKAPDGAPYDWYFFNEHRRVPYDWDPKPPMTSSEQSVTKVSVAPLETGAFLVQVAWGPFDLLPSEPLRRVGEPPSPPRVPVLALPAEAWGEEYLPTELDGMRLSGRSSEALEERRRRDVSDPAELDHPLNFRGGRWRVVPDARALERLFSALTGPRRPHLFANPVLVYTLFRGGARPRLGEFVRALDLAKRYGFKGVFTVLPRG